MRQLRLPLLVLAYLCMAPMGVSAQEETPVDRRSERQIADSTKIAALARSLVRDVAGDSARAAAVYEWVTHNVRYDAPAFFRGGKGHESAEAVFRHRIALCGGFVAMYERLAREVGLSVVPVTGYAKGVDYVFGRSTKKPNHAWLAMHIGGEWRLIDPTWGAGVINGRRFEPRFTWDFFLVPPEELILSHFPEEAEWQLLAAPLARSDFERMRAVPRTLLGIGFSAADIRTTALTPGVQDFPLVGPQGPGVRVVHAPISGTLPALAQVTIEVEWPGASEVSVVTNGAWTKLARSGSRFRGAATAGGSSLAVVGRIGDDAMPYHTLLHYRVAGGSRARASSR